MSTPEASSVTRRLDRQMDFILRIDALKSVERRSYLMSGERFENSAEHCWHVSLMAVLLVEHAGEPVDVGHVVRMLLVHDLVEIDAGDTYCYDEEALRSQAARELEAAERLFGMLPPDQAEDLRGLWDEFEAGVTAEARFAVAVDRLMPFMHNFHNDGRSWLAHGVTVAQAERRLAPIADGSPALAQIGQDLLHEAARRGWLAAC